LEGSQEHRGQLVEERDFLGRVGAKGKEYQSCLFVVCNMSVKVTVVVDLSIWLLTGSLLVSLARPFLILIGILLLCILPLALLLGPSGIRIEEFLQLIELVLLLVILDDLNGLQGLILLCIPRLKEEDRGVGVTYGVLVGLYHIPCGLGSDEAESETLSVDCGEHFEDRWGLRLLAEQDHTVDVPISF